MEKNKKIRVAAYCRVSTASDMQDGSFETQCDYFRNWVLSKPNTVLVDVYGDHGKSGRNMAKRPAFQRMMQDCKDGKVDMIITKSVSRFARNIAECVHTIRDLQSLGISVLFEKEALHTGDERNELFLCILATVAQEESNSISNHIAWSRRERAMAGEPYGVVAYGYRGGKARRHVWRVDEQEARRVRLAFDMANHGECYMDIRAALQEMEDAEGTGKVWSQYNLGYLLRNEYYTGDYIVNKTCEIETATGKKKVWNMGQREQFYIEEHHEPLVSRDVFDRVEKLMQSGLLNSKKHCYRKEESELLKQAV